jgi:hypothetical protein
MVYNEIMKNWLKENWFKVSLLVILIVFGCFFAYSEQIKPANAREDCSKTAIKDLPDDDSKYNLNNEEIVLLYNLYYNTCLNSKGVQR